MKTQEKKQAKKLSKAAECIVFASPKGGTGRTTSCLSIAGYLARNGSKVLVVDFDPQANATSGLGIDATTLHHTIYDVVLNHCVGYHGMPITQVILETDVENLHVAPSEFNLDVAAVLMQHSANRAGMLNRILEEVRALYDYILIDVPASSGLLAINGLCASDQVVVPLDPSIFSLESLGNLKTSLDDIRQMAGHSIDQITVVLIRYFKPNLFSKMFHNHKPSPSLEIEERLRAMFHTVFVVPYSVEIYQAQREGIPVSHSAPESSAGKAYAKIAESLSTNAHHKKQ